MDEKQKDDTAETATVSKDSEQQATVTAEPEANTEAKKASSSKKSECRHKASHKEQKSTRAKGKAKKAAIETISDEDSVSDSDSDSSSDDQRAAKKKKKKEKEKEKSKRAKFKSKSEQDKKRRRFLVGLESSSSEDSNDESSSDDDPPKERSKKSGKKSGQDNRKRKSKKKEDSETSDSDADDDSSSSDDEISRRKSGKKVKKVSEVSDELSAADQSEDNGDEIKFLQDQLEAINLRFLKASEKQKKAGRSAKRRESTDEKKPSKSKRKTSKTADALVYKRVDQLWDTHTHNYKLKESAEDDESEFAEFAFLVRRRFNWENKYRDTVVDIKAKPLRAVLQEVMKDCKSVSLEAEEPSLDPNILFLYLEELRTYYKKTLKSKIKSEKKRKNLKKLAQQRSLCKTLVSYIDEDYAEIKKTLYPLLDAGNITFDLMWALFKPNEIAVTSCYGNWEEPRCFKVEYATKFETMQRGEWYCIEGKYLEYDGKAFGFGDFEADVDAFKGPRKITSLATYPLKYHKNPEKVTKQIMKRGEQFVAMEGMNYKFFKGMAYMKKKRMVAKININGRVMVDPATFRRINPNYPISLIKAKDSEDLFNFDSDSDDCSCCGDESDKENDTAKDDLKNCDDYSPKYKYKWSKNDEGRLIFLPVEVDEDGNPIRSQRVDQLAGGTDRANKAFTEEELLLTSPVVLGFAFSEKLWLEFSLSGIQPIVYNENAFESLVLPPNQKEIVRALVESHKFNAAKTIDDVVQGKGKGLVSVLHGPPGTGKTLTAEGISELLKCPLYMVSAGELGTDPARLEHELQKILDIAHSWGAVLLLDEADVFLEKRQVHDIHRNALVSIFLRLLEYFQGILFLTTNRVDTFDEAFQSRIHLPLRYGDLTNKAKKAVWAMFLDQVRKQDAASVTHFSDRDLDILSRHQLNGRQIKNAVRTAQALALKEDKKMDMHHVKKVLDVGESFERDLKGGTGYLDAMRSYT
ncbi:hypothetical protein M433DRAFT_145598 [Acidomyces richmondensis BFW]|nr:MAG: hypothetical protein FE78DRAFT_78297 [Acidomyces sp. 'richmondensis']KYG43705.1 hypothetical protein M433DRAFT_145598 [Acidomyces richmondensis BFW]